MKGSDEPWDIVLHRLTAARLGIELPEDDDDDQADDVAAMAERLGIKPSVLTKGQELAKYSEEELSEVIAQFRAKDEEMTTEDILKQLRRNRRKKRGREK